MFTRALGVLFVFVLASEAATGAPVGLTLRTDVVLDHPHIVLGDLALVDANPELKADIEKVALGRVPRIGYAERMTRGQLTQAIQRQGAATMAQLEWRGAESVNVRSASHMVDGQLAIQAAREAVLAEFGAAHSGLEIVVATEMADLEVPSGQLAVRTRPLRGAALAARMTVWIDVLVDGAVYRSVVVPLVLSQRQPTYVARHDLAIGDVASAADVEVVEQEIIGTGALQVVAPEAAKRWRLRQALKAGQILAQGSVAPIDAVLRGDVVRLVVSTGPIGVETTGVVLADALPGQMVTVRPAGAHDTVTGRLGAGAVVHIE